MFVVWSSRGKLLSFPDSQSETLVSDWSKHVNSVQVRVFIAALTIELSLGSSQKQKPEA